MSVLARRYARALFEVAEARAAVDAVAADLASIDAVFADPELRTHVLRSDLSARAVGSLLARLGEGRHELVRNLLRALGQRRRHHVLPDLAAAFEAIARDARGEIAGVAESAGPLGDAERDALRALAGRLSGRSVHLEFHEDPELIGGVRLRLGNTLYDGSVAATLAGLRQRLLDVRIA
jgi:F-type H+-transporting ATPase subunit delta